ELTPQDVGAVGSSDRVTRPREQVRPNEFSRLTAQVSPGRVRYLINGRQIYEDTEAAPTVPWLMLAGGTGDKTVFRNVTIIGKPEVLSEVKLTAGNSLEGWTASVYMSRLPQRLAQKERELNGLHSGQGQGEDNDENFSKDAIYDWQAQDGELLGRKMVQPGTR